MSPLAKYIIAGSSSLFVSLLLFAAFVAAIGYFTFRHFSIMGGGGSPVTEYDTPIVLALAVGALATFLICPATACLLRNVISSLSETQFARVILFVLVAASQLSSIGLIIGGIFAYSNYQTYARNKEFRREKTPLDELERRLKETNTDVRIKKARILADSGKIVNAEVTLQLVNAPDFLPYFEFHIAAIGDYEDFFITPRKPSNENLSNPWVVAEREEGGWSFTDRFTGREYSGGPDEIVLRIEFSRKTADLRAKPTTIRPVLTHEVSTKIPGLGHFQFFNKAIPISFEHVQDSNNAF